MKNFKFKTYHCTLQFIMDQIGKLRLKLREGSKLETKLAGYHLALLDKQMAARKKAGIEEIECHVIWGGNLHD